MCSVNFRPAGSLASVLAPAPTTNSVFIDANYRPRNTPAAGGPSGYMVCRGCRGFSARQRSAARGECGQNHNKKHPKSGGIDKVNNRTLILFAFLLAIVITVVFRISTPAQAAVGSDNYSLVPAPSNPWVWVIEHDTGRTRICLPSGGGGQIPAVSCGAWSE